MRITLTQLLYILNELDSAMMSNDTYYAVEDKEKSKSTEKTETASYASERQTITSETIFELLANCHRRTVLSYLENTNDGRASTSDLAAYVSQHPSVDNSPDDIKIQLHHSVLPKLADAGLINDEPETKTVQYIGHPLVEACLNLINDQ